MLPLNRRSTLFRLLAADRRAEQSQLHADILAALANIGATVRWVHGAPHIVRADSKVAVALLAKSETVSLLPGNSQASKGTYGQ